MLNRPGMLRILANTTGDPFVWTSKNGFDSAAFKGITFDEGGSAGYGQVLGPAVELSLRCPAESIPHAEPGDTIEGLGAIWTVVPPVQDSPHLGERILRLRWLEAGE